MQKNKTLPDSLSALFTQEQRWQSWLDIEAVLAEVQGELGMIPPEHAQRIVAHAHLQKLDLDALKVDIRRTMAPVLSIVHALADVCGKEAGGYVHWGATTQNIMVGGRVLQMRQAHGLLLARLGQMLETLAYLAQEHASTVMAGRTNRKHALPITFGFKVASWIDELVRCVERLRGVEPRVFTLVFGGAIGAMHTFGAQGEPLVQRMAEKLQLTTPLVHSRATLDSFSEYIVNLSLFGMAASRIAHEVYALMEEEINELSEFLSDGVVGSSTMPHKDNPKHVVVVIARAARLRALAAPALEAGQSSHEGDAANNHLMYSLIDEACLLAYEVAAKMDELLGLVKVNPTAMARNIERTADVIASEHLMMVLAEKLGRQSAHDMVHEAIRTARSEGLSLVNVLLRHANVAEHFDAHALSEAIKPGNYIGRSREISLQAAHLAREIAAPLKASGHANDRMDHSCAIPV